MRFWARRAVVLLLAACSHPYDRPACGPQGACASGSGSAAYQSAPPDNARDRSVVLDELGNLALETGDLAGAKARFEESLGLRRKLAHDNPTSAQAQRDVSVSLNKVGDVAVQGGDLAGAKARFEEGLAILRKLAHDNPTSAQAQRDVSVSLERRGDVAVNGGG